MAMARILHTESSMGWGGQEMRILAEARGMIGRGHQVTVACRPGSGIAQNAPLYAVPTISASLGGPGDLRGILQIAGYCRALGIEIVSTHSSGDSWCAGMGGRLAGRKVIRTRHLSIAVKKGLSSRFLYGSIPHFVVTTGQALADRLVEDGLVDGRCAFSIPTGIDCSRFLADVRVRQQVRAEFGLEAGPVVVGVLAMVRQMKGHRVLVEASGEILKACPQVRFLLVGDAPTGNPVKREIEDLAQAMGVKESFIFAGYREDTHRMLNAMDILALPSIRDEGVPQSISQAMATSLPVVATRVGAVAEQVLEGKTGILVNPGDGPGLAEAIIKLVGDAGLRDAFGQEGRIRAEQVFSLDAMLDSTEELVARLLAGRH